MEEQINCFSGNGVFLMSKHVGAQNFVPLRFEPMTFCASVEPNLAFRICAEITNQMAAYFFFCIICEPKVTERVVYRHTHSGLRVDLFLSFIKNTKAFLVLMLGKSHPLVRELGGKHGGLVHVIDQGFGDNVVPLEITRYGENFSQAQIDRARRQLEKWGARKIMMRTSHPGDLVAMTDVLPTNDCDIDEIQRIFDEICKKLADPRLAQFAENERSWFESFDAPFAPEQCTISIAPYLGKDFSVITEHPNCQDRILYDAFNGNYWSVDWFPNEGYNPCVELRSRLRNAGLLSEDDAFQYEMGCKQQEAMLFQIRHFAKKNIAPHTRFGGQGPRILGNTGYKVRDPDDWIIQMLESEGNTNPSEADIEVAGERFYGEDHDPVFSHLTGNPFDLWGFLQSTPITEWQNFEASLPETPHILINNTTWQDAQPLTHEDQPKAMNVFLSRNVALGHQNTRFVQYALKRDGIAFLANGQLELESIAKKVKEAAKRNDGLVGFMTSQSALLVD